MTDPRNGVQRRALVVHESMFGNTTRIATAVGRGLESSGWHVEVVPVDSAPTTLPRDVSLLVVGAPTHAFSLSRPSTRAEAVVQGAPATVAALGMREWLTALHPWVRWPRLAVFDTRVTKVAWTPKLAGRRAARIARHRGFTDIGRPVSFLVSNVKGPLVGDELERAESWGRSLGQEQPLVTRAA